MSTSPTGSRGVRRPLGAIPGYNNRFDQALADVLELASGKSGDDAKSTLDKIGKVLYSLEPGTGLGRKSGDLDDVDEPTKQSREQSARSRKDVKDHHEILDQFNNNMMEICEIYRSWKLKAFPKLVLRLKERLTHLDTLVEETGMLLLCFRGDGGGRRYHHGVGLFVNLPFAYTKNRLLPTYEQVSLDPNFPPVKLQENLDTLAGYLIEATTQRVSRTRSLLRGEADSKHVDAWLKGRGWNEIPSWIPRKGV